MANIQRMIDDDFIFRTFYLAISEMSKNEEIYKKHFCSNKYLIRVLIKWHQETQSLYIRRLAEASGKETCSLMNLLTNIEKNACSVNRKLFCNYHKKDDDKIHNTFDILSEKKHNREDSDKISVNYIKNLKEKLEKVVTPELKKYTDKVIAHSDFKGCEIPNYDDIIKKCHKQIVEIYREIELNFFLRASSFGSTSLREELVLQNANQPFIANQK